MTEEEIQEYAKAAQEPAFVVKELTKAVKKPVKLFEEVRLLDKEFQAGRIHSSTVGACMRGLRSLVSREGKQ